MRPSLPEKLTVVAGLGLKSNHDEVLPSVLEFNEKMHGYVFSAELRGDKTLDLLVALKSMTGTMQTLNIRSHSSRFHSFIHSDSDPVLDLVPDPKPDPSHVLTIVCESLGTDQRIVTLHKGWESSILFAIMDGPKGSEYVWVSPLLTSLGLAFEVDFEDSFFAMICGRPLSQLTGPT